MTSLDRIDESLCHWRARKLTICKNCHRIIKHHSDPTEQAIARVRLRMIQEHLWRVRLARRLGRFLRREVEPFTADDHARLFDAIHESREAIEAGRVALNRLRPPSQRLSLERLR
jgi:hypothetical protein